MCWLSTPPPSYSASLKSSSPVKAYYIRSSSPSSSLSCQSLVSYHSITNTLQQMDGLMDIYIYISNHIYKVVCYPTHMPVQMQLFITNTHAVVEAGGHVVESSPQGALCRAPCLSCPAGLLHLHHMYRERVLEAADGTVCTNSHTCDIFMYVDGY